MALLFGSYLAESAPPEYLHDYHDGISYRSAQTRPKGDLRNEEPSIAKVADVGEDILDLAEQALRRISYKVDLAGKTVLDETSRSTGDDYTPCTADPAWHWNALGLGPEYSDRGNLGGGTQERTGVNYDGNESFKYVLRKEDLTGEDRQKSEVEKSHSEKTEEARKNPFQKLYDIIRTTVRKNSVVERLRNPLLALTTCDYDEQWRHFRRSINRNLSRERGAFEDGVYHLADKLVQKHFQTFLAFKKSKSNEYFYDCSRPKIRGEICYYGMLTAVTSQQRYLTMKRTMTEELYNGELRQIGDEIERHLQRQRVLREQSSEEQSAEAMAKMVGEAVEKATQELEADPTAHIPDMLGRETDVEKKMFKDVTGFLQLLLMNKNNCLDFLDGSGWPVDRLGLMEETRLKHWQPVQNTHPLMTQRLLLEEFPKSFWGDRPHTSRQYDPSTVWIYAAGTHSSLAQEPLTMFEEFIGPAHDIPIKVVYEILDSTHCQFFATQKCQQDGHLPDADDLLLSEQVKIWNDGWVEGRQSSEGANYDLWRKASIEQARGDRIKRFGRSGLQSLDAEKDVFLGLQKVSDRYFQQAWGNLLIQDFHSFAKEMIALFDNNEVIKHERSDIILCSSPAVFCSIFEKYINGEAYERDGVAKKFLIGYIGEPLMLAVDKPDHDWWFRKFEDLRSNEERAFFASYNPFLKHMIRYQTGVDLPVIRVAGKYTEMSYAFPRRELHEKWNKVLIAKGPNICLDPVCMLRQYERKFSEDGRRLNRLVKDIQQIQYNNGDGTEVVEPNVNAESLMALQSYVRAEYSVQNTLRYNFTGLDEFGAQHGTPPLSYGEMCSDFLAVIMYPYDVSLMLFYELYAAGVPLYSHI